MYFYYILLLSHDEIYNIFQECSVLLFAWICPVVMEKKLQYVKVINVIFFLGVGGGGALSLLEKEWVLSWTYTNSFRLRKNALCQVKLDKVSGSLEDFKRRQYINQDCYVLNSVLIGPWSERRGLFLNNRINVR